MRTHAQKQSRPQQKSSLQPSQLTQHKIRNQAIPALPHANAEGRKVVLITSAPTHFAYDFSRILLHSKAPVSLQAKLTVNSPGDTYEPEAGCADVPVTSVHEPQLQRASCECGGCPNCQNRQADHEHLQTKRVQANDSGEMAAEPIVHEVLRSSGQPLDPSTRGFMEMRFGHDFSQVRVHADGEAANAARSVDARAYTIGRDIVFGDRQYQPATAQGKLLLAHELTHVVQQSNGGAAVAHRQADESATSQGAIQSGESDSSKRLRAIIADIERVQANASQSLRDEGTSESNMPESPDHVEQVMDFLEQLRTVESGNDEELKLRVLTGFSSQGIQQAEAKLAKADTTVSEQMPESVAAKPLGVSHPRDAAEVEADRVAQAVVHGSPVTVTQSNPAGLVSRQAEAFAAAGAAVLAFEAETLPLTAWNPPGWVINGVELLLAAALLGTAAYLSSRALRRCRCTRRYAPPDIEAMCPDRVYGTGVTIGDCQNVAKFTAPQPCRQYYGHCGWMP